MNIDVVHLHGVYNDNSNTQRSRLPQEPAALSASRSYTLRASERSSRLADCIVSCLFVARGVCVGTERMRRTQNKYYVC